MPEELAWRRLWVPQGEAVMLDDDGIVADPEGFHFHQHLRHTAQLTAPCLILLGDPGMGKSTELRGLFRSAHASAESAGNLALLKDLRLPTSDVGLLHHLFEDAQIKAWRAGTHRLYLFLDSLDECRLRVPTVVGLLANELREVPAERLHLRLACRGAEWPDSLSEELLATSFP
jgi:hypothetical protein